METRGVTPPLVVIAGPTASGKTGLAISLAERFNGEIICADSRTIYRGMDVGTAKPTADDQARVPHWGVDLVEPGDRFTAADFKEYANTKIADIRNRQKIPFLVGGTGLYIDSVIFDFQFGISPDEQVRYKLEQMNVEQLHYYCRKHNIKLPENSQNKRYIIRAIELKGLQLKRRATPLNNTIVVGIATSISTLHSRIRDRSEQIFENDVVKEAMILGKKYGWSSEAMTGNIYPIAREFLRGNISRTELVERFIASDRQLAKRQMTWLRRNEHLLWADLPSAEQYLVDQLGGRR